MQLTAATQLTKLDVEAMQFNGDDNEGIFQFVCTNQVRGCKTAVWVCVRVDTSGKAWEAAGKTGRLGYITVFNQFADDAGRICRRCRGVP